MTRVSLECVENGASFHTDVSPYPFTVRSEVTSSSLAIKISTISVPDARHLPGETDSDTAELLVAGSEGPAPAGTANASASQSVVGWISSSAGREVSTAI